MSDFFEAPPPPEPVPSPPEPPWLGPPANELGVPVPLRLVLARTDEVVLALFDVVAFSNGIELRLEVRLRSPDDDVDPFAMRLRHRAALPDDLLRFGFELADGRRVTNVGGFPQPSERGDAPVLIQRGGGGGGRSWSFGYWLWPLPPPGPLTAAVEWPARGIGLTRVEVEADAIRAAAARSEQLWPGGEPDGGGSVIEVLRDD